MTYREWTKSEEGREQIRRIYYDSANDGLTYFELHRLIRKEFSKQVKEKFYGINWTDVTY